MLIGPGPAVLVLMQYRRPAVGTGKALVQNARPRHEKHPVCVLGAGPRWAPGGERPFPAGVWEPTERILQARRLGEAPLSPPSPGLQGRPLPCPSPPWPSAPSHLSVSGANRRPFGPDVRAEPLGGEQAGPPGACPLAQTKGCPTTV